jgi:hypothetical protein
MLTKNTTMLKSSLTLLIFLASSAVASAQTVIIVNTDNDCYYCGVPMPTTYSSPQTGYYTGDNYSLNFNISGDVNQVNVISDYDFDNNSNSIDFNHYSLKQANINGDWNYDWNDYILVYSHPHFHSTKIETKFQKEIQKIDAEIKEYQEKSGKQLNWGWWKK